MYSTVYPTVRTEVRACGTSRQASHAVHATDVDVLRVPSRQGLADVPRSAPVGYRKDTVGGEDVTSARGSADCLCGGALTQPCALWF